MPSPSGRYMSSSTRSGRSRSSASRRLRAVERDADDLEPGHRAHELRVQLGDPEVVVDDEHPDGPARSRADPGRAPLQHAARGRRRAPRRGRRPRPRRRAASPAAAAGGLPGEREAQPVRPAVVGARGPAVVEGVPDRLARQAGAAVGDREAQGRPVRGQRDLDPRGPPRPLRRRADRVVDEVAEHGDDVERPQDAGRQPGVLREHDRTPRSAAADALAASSPRTYGSRTGPSSLPSGSTRSSCRYSAAWSTAPSWSRPPSACSRLVCSWACARSASNSARTVSSSRPRSSRSVRSRRVSTRPRSRPARVTGASVTTSTRSPASTTWSCAPAVSSPSRAGSTSASGVPGTSGAPSSRRAASLASAIRPAVSTASTPVLHPVQHRLVLEHEVGELGRLEAERLALEPAHEQQHADRAEQQRDEGEAGGAAQQLHEPGVHLAARRCRR